MSHNCGNCSFIGRRALRESSDVWKMLSSGDKETIRKLFPCRAKARRVSSCHSLLLLPPQVHFKWATLQSDPKWWHASVTPFQCDYSVYVSQTIADYFVTFRRHSCSAFVTHSTSPECVTFSYYWQRTRLPSLDIHSNCSTTVSIEEAALKMCRQTATQLMTGWQKGRHRRRALLFLDSHWVSAYCTGRDI